MNKREFGWVGEASAEEYLVSQGYETVGKNVYVGRCEIDLIVKSDTHILFIEVKTRRQIPDVHSPYGRPATAVNAAKRNNLLTAVRRYIHENREAIESLQPRIDIVEVYVDPRGDTYRVLDVKHFPNAVHP